MCKALNHRGPDGYGYFTDQCVSLGHRRLAIIDLALGAQPMGNEDQTAQVVFNGEIYNYLELRQELIGLGHVFRTNSDTEVLVHGWESWKEGLFPRLNGMFALAIYDLAHRRLILARDPLGEKPLHYFQADGQLIFASEIKAILAHPIPRARRELDMPALAQYLCLEYVPSPACLFKGIKKLRAGHFLIAQESGVQERAFWDLEQACQGQEVPARLEEAAAKFWDLFLLAVKRRLISDVPLGVFLSGGLDSLAVSLAANQAVGGGLKTFSIGFDEKGFDESEHARAAAAHLGTQHNQALFNFDQCLDAFHRVLAGLDEPMADSSILPTLLLSRFTRQNVTVALSGDGADEFLGGYPTFKAHQLAVSLGHVGRRWAAGLAPIANLLPMGHGHLSLVFRLRWFLRSLNQPAGPRLLAWLGAFNAEELPTLLTPEARAALSAEIDPHSYVAGKPTDFTELSYLTRLYARTYLENDILVKVDRAAMLNSLEVRPPFLDPELVAFMAALPDHFKLHPQLGGKALLKTALAGRVPDKLRLRPKQGFGIPLAGWLAGPLSELVRDLLCPNALHDQGLFDPQTVWTLVREHQTGRTDHRKFLWTLIMFQGWRRYWLDQPLLHRVENI